MDKYFATWISCTLLKILSIWISLSQVATSYLFGQLFVLCTLLIMFILLILCTLLILDSSLSPSRTKNGRHFTLDMDGEMTCSWLWQCLYVLDIWYVVHDHFFVCICGYWTWFLTHKCIFTIFRQVIFVDICGYLCQFMWNLWKCLGNMCKCY